MTLISQRIPWAVIPFVLSLFLLVEALNTYGLVGAIGRLISSIAGDSAIAYTFVYGLTSTLTANLINNIPMTVAFASLVQTVPSSRVSAAVFATVIGSNLGANLTPIGALAGIMWMRIVNGKAFRITFWEFVKYGLLVTPLTLLSGLAILGLEMILF
jgi:arsenical pump membrane protein